MYYFNILTENKDTCNNLFTPDALKILNELLSYFRLLAPVVLIIMIAVDLVGIMLSSNNPQDKSHKLYISRIVRRCIATILLFFVPTFVSILLNLDGVKDTLQVDPLCLNAKGTESSAESIYDMFGLDDGKHPTSNESEGGGSNQSGNGQNGKTELFGACDAKKRCRKTVTIKGRTYDSYMQGDFADVGFSGQNIKLAGCSCVAMTQAASGFNRDITIFQAATMFSERTFEGIGKGLRQLGIPYSSIIYFNSTDYHNSANGKSRAQNVVNQVRAHLNQGKPAIAIIQGAPYAGGQPHFITIFGEDDEGHMICGNCRKEVGSLEELVASSLQGGRKGFMLVG